MKSANKGGRFTIATLMAASLTPGALALERVKVAGGLLEGVLDGNSGIASFKGIPFAEPPVDNLRWKPPRTPLKWKGVRKADAFGPRAMQNPIFGDMGFRSNGMGEDCLYLNVWTPAASGKEKMPVLVYFYGGGFNAGDGSEARYDGGSMAKKGIVAVTVNYRLGVFGFLAHPGLTRESAHHASGNYGLLDQCAALEWVRRNIAAFGGDPGRITIAGESAGSSSVSALMASPLSKDMIAGAIGESGSSVGNSRTRAEAEQAGSKFAAGLGIGDAPSLADLRRMTADKLLEAAGKPGVQWFWPIVDGYFLPKPAADIYSAGKQARVPLLVGSNSEEGSWTWFMGGAKPTADNYRAALKKAYGDAADSVFKLYPASGEAGVMSVAQDLASDRFISLETWRWLDLATQTGGKPTFYYLYSHPRPSMRPEQVDAVPGLAGGVVKGKKPADQPPPAHGACHSCEIEYAMGNLDSNKVYAWAPEDYAVSKVMQDYFANFIKTGDPNGPGLPEWPRYDAGKRQVIDVNTRAEPVRVRERYKLLGRLKND